VDDVNAKTTIAARIPQELARSVSELAQRGNRTVSREVWAAVAEHVANQDPGGSDLLSPPGPAERDGTSQAGQSNPSPLAGAET
jgi:hypothetical protein